MFKEIIKPSLVLMIITIVAGFGLSVVYAITREPAAQRMAETVTAAMGEIFPDAQEISVEGPDVLGFEAGPEIFDLYRVSDQGDVVGYAVGSRFMGFGGTLYLLVGIDMDGQLTGVDVLRHSETPGFGGNLTQPWFTSQFAHKYGELVYVSPGTDVEDTASNEIVGLTSSTGTTRAVVQAVNNAIVYFTENIAN